MSATTAALVLSWVAIVVMFLGMTGMLRMIRELQREVMPDARQFADRSGLAVRFAPTHAAFAMVLLHEKGCSSCTALEPDLARFVREHPEVEFHSLTPSSAAPYAGLPTVVDAPAFRALQPGYTPAVAVIDRGGAVVDIGPAADLATLSDFVARHGSPTT